jgi:hypothetical protein
MDVDQTGGDDLVRDVDNGRAAGFEIGADRVDLAVANADV